jgi:universal stress protein E
MPSSCILVVYDPTTDAQPALARAAALAKSAQKSGTDVTLHVYSCIYAKLPTSGGKLARKAELIAAQKEIVGATIAELVDSQIPVNVEVEWEKDWYQAIVKAADRIGAAAVFKSSHKRSATRRLLQNTSDRVLLRECACPVLLVKSESTTTSPDNVILAAVQFRDEEGAYNDLNHRIVTFCQQLFSLTSVEVHFVNAYTELSNRPDTGELIRACGVPNDQVHIEMGETGDVIVETARRLGASTVVIGNSARDGFAAVIHTNTAEMILDKLDCNLLAMPG